MKKFVKILTACVLCIATLLCITACAPANADKAKAKMEDLGYSVSKQFLNDVEVEHWYNVEIDGDTYRITALKGLNSITVFYFDKAKDAKTFYEEYVVQQVALFDKVELKGKLVIYGSIEAYEDFM